MTGAGDRAPFQGQRSTASSNRVNGSASTILAFDFGERYIGVAVGERGTGLANPLTYIEGAANAVRFARIEELIAEWQPGTLVLGLPLSMDGEEHELTRRVRRFARQLEGRFDLPVILVDERLSSAAAEDMLRDMGRGGHEHKNDSHALAAQIILQAWLDEQRTATPGAADKGGT